MIALPDFKKKFDYENNFYLSCDTSRLGKIVAQYELYKITQNLAGAIVECGVLKGCSLVRFAAFRDLGEEPHPKKILGFDSFGPFPQTSFEPDKKMRHNFIKDVGMQSISKQQLTDVFNRKKCKNFELISGDITRTLPRYLARHPKFKVSLLNLDVDIYEPSKVVLELLYPRLVRGGVLILDDYGIFPGETKAVNEYFKGKRVKIRQFSFCVTPKYIIKE